MAIVKYYLNSNHPKKRTKDKVWLDDYCGIYRVSATTGLRIINTKMRHVLKENTVHLLKKKI